MCKEALNNDQRLQKIHFLIESMISKPIDQDQREHYIDQIKIEFKVFSVIIDYTYQYRMHNSISQVCMQLTNNICLRCIRKNVGFSKYIL